MVKDPGRQHVNSKRWSRGEITNIIDVGQIDMAECCDAIEHMLLALHASDKYVFLGNLWKHHDMLHETEYKMMQLHGASPASHAA